MFFESLPSPSMARTCASPHAMVFIWIPYKLETWVGIVISEVYIWPRLAFSSTERSLKMSSPSWPRSFMPHPYSSPLSVRNRVNVEPQNTLEIDSSFSDSILRGSMTLLFSMPRPGSKLSEEKPIPSWPYRLMPHP